MNARGAHAENAAAAYLIAAGLRILARNVRTPEGEIDILAREGNDIVVVEVKARANGRFGSALGAVDARKRRRLRAAGENLLQFSRNPALRLRFDVVAFDGGRVRHIRGAFGG